MTYRLGTLQWLRKATPMIDIWQNISPFFSRVDLNVCHCWFDPDLIPEVTLQMVSKGFLWQHKYSSGCYHLTMQSGELSLKADRMLSKGLTLGCSMQSLCFNKAILNDGCVLENWTFPITLWKHMYDFWSLPSFEAEGIKQKEKKKLN